MPTPMEFAERFKDLREKAGLTGTALAKPRYSVSYISQIEAGRRRPSQDALSFFADRLGVSREYLATGIPEGIEARLLFELEDIRLQLSEGRADEAMTALSTLLSQAEQYSLRRLWAVATTVLGDALRARGRSREAIDAYERALEEDGLLPSREAGMAVGGLARAYRASGDLTYAGEVVEAFLGRRGHGPLDPSVATDLQSVLVSIYFERGDVIRAERAARRALASADGDTPTRVRAVAYWHAGRVLAETRQFDEAMNLVTRARVLMEELDDRRRVARLHNAYAFLCLEVEPPRIEEARSHLDTAERLLTDSAAPGDLALVLTERSRLALLEENPEEAFEQAERALPDAEADEAQLALCLYMKGRALGMMERRSEARCALQEAATLYEGLGSRQQQAACWRELGELDLAAGDVQSAVESLRAGLRSLDPRRSRA
jgi:tetratricopeptide (TPR) repeat protein